MSLLKESIPILIHTQFKLKLSKINININSLTLIVVIPHFSHRPASAISIYSCSLFRCFIVDTLPTVGLDK